MMMVVMAMVLGLMLRLRLRNTLPLHGGGKGGGRLTEPRRGPPGPVGADRGRGAFQVQDDHLGQNLAEPPVPLKGKLYVSPRRVPVVVAVLADVVAVLNQCRAVEELKEADRDIAVDLTDPSRANGIERVEPVAAFMGVVIP